MRGQVDDKESVRRKAEARKAKERAEAEAEERVRVREAQLQERLARKPKSLAERLIGYDMADAKKRDPSYYQLILAVTEKAPRLAEGPMPRAFREIAKLPFLRDPATWEPRGKGRETLFRSLCTHLFAAFPMPAFLWTAFSEENAEAFSLFVAHVAQGGSAHGAVKAGFLPVPLTRQMCHDFMSTPAEVGFFRALRWVVVKAYGGSHRFFTAWMASRAGGRLHTAADEAFWITVLEWFGKNPMVDPNQVGPLVDYIGYCRRQNPATFTMKGRGILAMLRGMEEWHGQLAKEKSIHGALFKPTGFRSYETTRSARTQNGKYIEETWRIEEILTSKALSEEGRVLGHCVYSYAWSIDKGQVSIWSLNLESTETRGRQKMVTIELRNDLKRIVQFRGKFNRQSTAREFQILTDWANLNGLEVRF